jgi:uncharacterized protein
MKKSRYLIILALIAISCDAQKISNRPQTPMPPFDYITDSVEYDNPAKNVHLAATLSYPKTGGPFTTIVMVSGSGQQDRDETIYDHKPFAIIADHLTKKGFAVLRVDDRGAGKSLGALLTSTSLDFADDVITSINYLMTRPEINKARIGIIGHSEGGLIAPIVYSKWPGLAFIISLAGPGVSGAEILLQQQTDPLKGAVNQSAFDAFYDLTRKTLWIIHDNPLAPDSVIISRAKTMYNQWKESNPDSILKPLRADRTTADQYAVQVRQELIPWLRYFISTEPSQFWQKVKCPVLVLNGEKDIQVNAGLNIQGIKNALARAGNEQVKTMILPGLNHLFQHCTSCSFQEYKELEESFAPEVLEIMEKWLKALH